MTGEPRRVEELSPDQLSQLCYSMVLYQTHFNMKRRMTETLVADLRKMWKKRPYLSPVNLVTLPVFFFFYVFFSCVLLSSTPAHTPLPLSLSL